MPTNPPIIISCAGDGIATPADDTGRFKDAPSGAYFFITAPTRLSNRQPAEYVTFEPYGSTWRVTNRRSIPLSTAFFQLANFEGMADQYRAIGRITNNNELIHQTDRALQLYIKLCRLPDSESREIHLNERGNGIAVSFIIPSRRRLDSGEATCCIQKFFLYDEDEQRHEVIREISHECAFHDLGHIAQALERGVTEERAVADYTRRVAEQKIQNLTNDHPALKTINIIKVWNEGALEAINSQIKFLEKLGRNFLGKCILYFMGKTDNTLLRRLKHDFCRLNNIMRLCEQGNNEQTESIIKPFQYELHELRELTIPL